MRDIADTLAFIALEKIKAAGAPSPEISALRPELTDAFEEFLNNLGTLPEAQEEDADDGTVGWIKSLAKTEERLGSARYLVRLKEFPNRAYYFSELDSANALLEKARKGEVQ